MAAGRRATPRSHRRPQRKCCADLLVPNTQKLWTSVERRRCTLTADQIGNGAKGLLDEVATSKVTGEEETWSHTDLWDFQANVEGAQVAYEGLEPVRPGQGPRRS